VVATGKKQLILAGITTDVCVTFLSLCTSRSCSLFIISEFHLAALREAGYEVYVVAEASGTFDVATAALSNDRMRDAGVQIMSWFSVACELMRDWRKAPGSVETAQKWFGLYVPNYAALFNSWTTAQTQ